MAHDNDMFPGHDHNCGVADSYLEDGYVLVPEVDPDNPANTVLIPYGTRHDGSTAPAWCTAIWKVQPALSGSPLHRFV